MKLTFNIDFHTVWGQRLCIVGSLPELGLWNPAQARDMQYINDGRWMAEIELKEIPSAKIEYRYILLNENNAILFEEWRGNHYLLPTSAIESDIVCYDSWQNDPVHQAFYSSAFTHSWFAHPSAPGELQPAQNKTLSIKVNAPCIPKNQNVCITGNQQALGNWDPDKSLKLNSSDSFEWYITLDISDFVFPLEYKFLICDDRHQLVRWESGENRIFSKSDQITNQQIILSGLNFRGEEFLWRCAGSVIPVFSLRSEQSFGVGDFSDLRKFIDWAALTHQRIVQVLPMNDTIATNSWKDSYPYSAISIYALHPIYISLTDLGELKDPGLNAYYQEKQKELNALSQIDYEEVICYKIAYCRDFYELQGESIMGSTDFYQFFEGNKSWLMPYGAFCYLRDHFGTADFSRWKKYAGYDFSNVEELCSENNPASSVIKFYYFLQYILHTQFKSVSAHAHSLGIVLKGDLPIGISRHSVEAWTEPRYFQMNAQAGAPPDDFSANGQNWLFPTYNWKEMESDHFNWWKKRFHKLEDYFDCFRIDHILGFFRIWEIPLEYVEGLCGHFNSALPYTEDEIRGFGFVSDIRSFLSNRIHQQYLVGLFADYTEDVISTYLAQVSSEYYTLKPFCDTQLKIAELFSDQNDEDAIKIKKGLFAIANEVLFLSDPYEPEKYHPRISASKSYLYKDLSSADRYAFDQLYWEFFYHRHNDYWKNQALNKLTPLINNTQMLVCGEDLGMIPESVPDVMNKLQILSLEIERMPKTALREFTDLMHLPYNSVCTTSTHDMPPLRSWWKEDRDKIQRYYNNVLHHAGIAPEDCSSALAEQIIKRHLDSPAMMTIIPLQDWLAMSDELKNPDAEAERINIPAQTNHYWRYRMHLTVEQLIQSASFNSKISTMIQLSGRNESND